MSLIPDFNFQITSTAVTAQPHKLKAQWSLQAAQDLRDLWDGSRWPRLPSNDLDRMRDALEDPNYDSNSPEPYEGLWRWEDGRIATPDEVEAAHPMQSIVEAATEEIKAGIDREIMRELTSPTITFNTDDDLACIGSPSAASVRMLNAVELSPCPRWTKDAARAILKQHLL